MQILYFAWVRERIGQRSESYEGDAQTVEDIIDALAKRSEAHKIVFSDRLSLRYALDHTLVEADTPVKDAHELAIFPPMTGG